LVTDSPVGFTCGFTGKVDDIACGPAAGGEGSRSCAVQSEINCLKKGNPALRSGRERNQMRPRGGGLGEPLRPPDTPVRGPQ